MTGTTIAQAIPVLVSPILTRLYTPEEFGVFSLFTSIVSVIYVISTGRFEIAIPLPKDELDALSILLMALILLIFICILVTVIIIIFQPYLFNIFNIEASSFWFYIIPVAILFNGIYQILNNWNIRYSNFKYLSISKVIQSATVATFNIAIGYSKIYSFGLIIGSILGLLFSVLYIFSHSKEVVKLVRYNVSNIDFYKVFYTYNHILIFNMPQSFFNILSSNIPVLLFSKYYTSDKVGYYSFANKLLMMPANIFSSAYAQVFFKRLNDVRDDKVERVYLVKNTIFKILFISLPFFIFIFIYSEDIFSIVFGLEWAVAGLYAKFLIPMFYFRLVGSVVSMSTLVFGEEKKSFIIELYSITLRVSVLILGTVIMNNIILTLFFYSLVSCLTTVFRLFWYVSITERFMEMDCE